MKHVPKETIQKIAYNLEVGFRCFLRVDTLELITYPPEDKQANFEHGMWKNEIQTVREGKDKYFEITGMDPHDSFRVMEDFIKTVNDRLLRDKLLHAIHQRSPFAHFNVQIDKSGIYRDRWFKFRDQKNSEWVEDQLKFVP